MDTAQHTESPTGPPPPPGPPPLSRLTRSTQDKVVSGLCGGLGRHFAIDPIVFRIAFVVLALAGGSGIVLYLVGWALIPDDQGGVIADRAGGLRIFRRVGEDRSRKLVAAVIAGGGLLILLNRITDGTDGDVALGLVLLGLGLAFFWSRRNAARVLPPGGGGGGGSPSWEPSPPIAADIPSEPSPAAAGDDAPDPSTSAAEPPTSSAAEVDVTTPIPAWPPTPAGPSLPPPTAVITATPRQWVRPPKPPKPRSVLVACTLSVLAIQAGILVLAGASLVTGLALSVLVVALALVVGTWMGRARWLIPIGLLLSVALGAAVLLDVPLEGGTGNRAYRPAILADLRSPYRVAAGEMTLNLSDLDLAATTAAIDASVAVGHLVVVVPASATIDLQGQVNAGTLVVFGRSWGGTSVKQDVVVPGPEGGGRLTLDAQVGVGELEVRRAAA